jgi:endonuclease/exonuclease/phosphatase family metal-dependent hydrolase
MMRLFMVGLGCLAMLAASCGAGELDGGEMISEDGGSSGQSSSPGRDAEIVDAGVDAKVAVDASQTDARSEDASTGENRDSEVEEDTSTPTDPSDLAQTMRFGAIYWNIAGGKENGCATAKIRRAVMRYVRNAPDRIDFVGLNEVCPAQYRAIRDALRNYWNKSAGDKFSAFQGSGGSRVGNAIFSRRNIYGVTRHDVGQDQWGTRYLLCGRQVNRRIRVCTIHLSPGDTKARRQLTRVLNKLENWWSNRRDTVVIGGDLNLRPNDHGLNKIYAPGANTPNNPNNHGHYRELDDDDPNHCKGYGQRSLPNTTGGPCNAGGKIDFMFVRANRIVNGRYNARTLNIPRDCTGVCSDHRAVRGYATIKFRVD